MTVDESRRGGPLWTGLYAVWGVAMAGQIVLLFLLPQGSIAWLVPIGWALFAGSAVLGWLPIFVMHRRGAVPKRKSYVHTTQLVTSGPYALVRHPQFLAGDLIAVAVMCITQHWGTLVAGAIGIVANRLSMLKADQALIEKFGEPYREYMARVPRANLPLGLFRWIRCR